MRVVLVANGDLPINYNERELRSVFATGDVVIAIDGGLRHCVALDVLPDLLIGDLDSARLELVSQARAAGATVVQYPADKDATDLELGLVEAVAMGATSVVAIAAFGGRLDHELATVALLASPRWREIAVSGVDGRRQFYVVRSELALDLAPGVTVSLMPWGGNCTGVSVDGVKWPLVDHDLALGSTLGVSNVAVDATQNVSVRDGTLLVIIDAVD